MKLCRFGKDGAERAGLVDAQGVLRSLEGHVADITPDKLAPEHLARLAGLDPASLPVVAGPVRYGVPVAGIGKYICIGLNYRDHAQEAGLAIPPEPIIFLKAISALCGPDDGILPPVGSTRLDWEVELAVIIGSRASNVAEDAAPEHVAGYCVANDVSERAFQMQSSQWDKGKGCDTFGPLGPWLVTRDEVPDPQNLGLWLDVNGRRMQAGNTCNMIFPVAEIVSYVSRYMTLLPGDVIATGTPPGVGMGMRPPVYLQAGDVVELGIDGLGRQRQIVAG
ncbi:fumarylacetoacetate hydrolase family protein [Acetobacter sp. TBRC 12305]|uniref:Fumarylacetoacetate hydrolase family protein n=1 Tax=Acetobacter garciniae TaxID=2817435 RepID=A0A939KMX7_9PROT|nr:fumarylacetoacetate hydrolase family protein [Acetobacter garciniae]MBO1325778.1 fumarylacetoacetate hydrolase family protein [Acetobacter garciniae]MBX0345678.1 fumarylacetoacetate hydrolase family protein [Acetobacter garciniae]